MWGMNEAVIAERTRRGLSVREASTAGGVANTTWARYEETGHLTKKMRKAVAQAFGWPAGWPEGEVILNGAVPAIFDDGRLSELAAKVDRWAAHAERRGQDMEDTIERFDVLTNTINVQAAQRSEELAAIESRLCTLEQATLEATTSVVGLHRMTDELAEQVTEILATVHWLRSALEQV
jgi:hypothetical protein